MIYRKLGRTGIDVGVVGLGAEYLEYAPRETVTSMVHELIDRGVNYIDLFMASPAVRDNFGEALAGKRPQVLITGHLVKNVHCRLSYRLVSAGLCRGAPPEGG